MGATALHGYSSMELKSRSFTSKEPHVAREPQVADPWNRRMLQRSRDKTAQRVVQKVPRTEKLVTSAIFKKYLQCVLAARILTVDFVACTLAVKKKNQGRFKHVGLDHSVVSLISMSLWSPCIKRSFKWAYLSLPNWFILMYITIYIYITICFHLKTIKVKSTEEYLRVETSNTVSYLVYNSLDFICYKIRQVSIRIATEAQKLDTSVLCSFWSHRHWWMIEPVHGTCPAITTVHSANVQLTYYYSTLSNAWSRRSVVDIETSYGLDDRGVGVRVPVRSRNFSLSKSYRRALGSTQPPPVGTGGSFPGVNAAGA
jgi:hypothetical protein